MTNTEWEALAACCAFVEAHTPQGVRVKAPAWAETRDGFDAPEIVRRAREALGPVAPTPAAEKAWMHQHPPRSARPVEFKHAHKVLVDLTSSAKVRLIEMLKTGDRDFKAVRAQLDRYADLQGAADIVSGQA